MMSATTKSIVNSTFNIRCTSMLWFRIFTFPHFLYMWPNFIKYEKQSSLPLYYFIFTTTKIPDFKLSLTLFLYRSGSLNNFRDFHELAENESC